MHNSIEQHCAHLFREAIGNAHTVPVTSWDDAKLMAEPLESFDVDSLMLLDFVMRVESAYDVELDEAEVNSCRTLGELAALVIAAKK
jgi:acyl carrier protein